MEGGILLATFFNWRLIIRLKITPHSENNATVRPPYEGCTPVIFGQTYFAACIYARSGFGNFEDDASLAFQYHRPDV